MPQLKWAIRRLIATVLSFLRQQDEYVVHRRALERGILRFGRHTYGIPIVDLYGNNPNGVTVGKFCSIARDVVFITGGIHPVHWVSTFPFRIHWDMPGALEDGTPASNGEIVVGSDVWIGTEAMILSGVTVGDGAVVAARSVVTHDIPPYAVVAGVPARVVRYRFDDGAIEALLRIRWWDWDDDAVREAVPYLSSDDLSGFLRKYGR